MKTTLIALVAHSSRQKAKGATTLDDIITRCFEGAKDHWMATQSEDQFQGAVCAIYELASEEDKPRIKEELHLIRSLSALLTGIPVDLGQVPTIENPIGLMKRWNEIREGTSVPTGSDSDSGSGKPK
jgi:hypothetical protein